jgi:3-O-methylgallate 3,4-dioxygenase
MARLVAAYGSSHSLMLVTTREDWLQRFRVSDRRMPLYDRAGNDLAYDDLLMLAPDDAEKRVRPEIISKAFDDTHKAIARLKAEIENADLDALIIVGDDQHELFDDSLMPAFAIYYGENIRNAGAPDELPEDWYKRAQMKRREPGGEVIYPCHAGLARHLIEGFTRRGADVTALKKLRDDQHEGHAYSYIHRTYLQERRIPVVPVFLNTYYPPNPPTPKRCVELGRQMAELIAEFPGDMRVGLIASGGLSHFVVDEELDRSLIEAFHAKDLDYLASLDPERLKAGSSEIRSWLLVAAAAGALDLGWMEYVPAYRSPALTGTGLGFAVWS